MFIYKSFSLPEDNLFFDDTLLALVNNNLPFVFRVWESDKYFLVKGISSPDEEVNIDKANQLGIRVLRRRSGGGTVLQGPGCVNYCAVFYAEQIPSVSESFSMVLKEIIGVFKSHNVDLIFKGHSDLVYMDRKVSGNAQRRRQNAFYAHGTLLYNMDMELISELLAMPSKEPEYRNGRSHRDFLTNLPISREQAYGLFLQVYRTLKKVRDL